MEDYEQESERRGLPVQTVLGDEGDRRRAIASIAITAVVGIVLLVLALIVGGDGPWWFFAVLGTIAILTVVIAAWNVRVWVVWGNPQLFLPSSQDLLLGDRVTVRFRRRARGPVQPSEVHVTARLRCYEEALGTADGTDETEVEVFDAPVEVSRIDVVGSAVEADLVVEVPVFAAPPSMELTRHRVGWRLIVRIEAPGAPDDDSTFAVTVAPRLADRVLVEATP
ncbi:MAG: hypothetical protein ACE367_19925 [Acidimicrobiales bacterium]